MTFDSNVSEITFDSNISFHFLFCNMFWYIGLELKYLPYAKSYSTSIIWNRSKSAKSQVRLNDTEQRVCVYTRNIQVSREVVQGVNKISLVYKKWYCSYLSFSII